VAASTSRAIALLLLAGCGNPDPAASTRYITEDGHSLERKLTDLSNSLGPDQLRSTSDPSAPVEFGDSNYFRLFWYRGDWLPQSVFDISLVGAELPGVSHGRVCRVQIGPNPVCHPFPIDFIFELFDDPDLALRARIAVGAVDIEHRYKIDLMIDGFRIHLEQFAGAGGPNVEIIVDGCGRVPQRRQARNGFPGIPLEFPGSLPVETRPERCRPIKR
jgi:hypothetical protein